MRKSVLVDAAACCVPPNARRIHVRRGPRSGPTQDEESSRECAKSIDPGTLCSLAEPPSVRNITMLTRAAGISGLMTTPLPRQARDPEPVERAGGFVLARMNSKWTPEFWTIGVAKTFRANQSMLISIQFVHSRDDFSSCVGPDLGPRRTWIRRAFGGTQPLDRLGALSCPP